MPMHFAVHPGQILGWSAHRLAQDGDRPAGRPTTFCSTSVRRARSGIASLSTNSYGFGVQAADTRRVRSRSGPARLPSHASVGVDIRRPIRSATGGHVRSAKDRPHRGGDERHHDHAHHDGEEVFVVREELLHETKMRFGAGQSELTSIDCGIAGTDNPALIDAYRAASG